MKMSRYAIALVWLINGLFCKVLNLVPRHEKIVSEIINVQYSRELITIIGFLEILMTFWILSKIQPKLNALVQMVIVGTMNIIEFLLVPDLLLWGHFNILFALMFIAFIYCSNFRLNIKIIWYVNPS